MVTFKRPKITNSSLEQELNNALHNIDVRKLTESVMLISSLKLDLRNKLDNDLFNHITYVANQSLLLLKKEGLDREAMYKIGKLLWRLCNVLMAYNAKKREPSIQQVVEIITDFKNIFTGV